MAHSGFSPSCFERAADAAAARELQHIPMRKVMHAMWVHVTAIDVAVFFIGDIRGSPLEGVGKFRDGRGTSSVLTSRRGNMLGKRIGIGSIGGSILL